MLAAFAAVLVFTPSAQATHGVVPVTVTISRLEALQDPDPGPGQGDGDFFARVQIDGFGAQQSGEVTGNTIEPFWTFTRMVDSDAVGDSIQIVIEVFDADSFLAAPDDVIDLDPADNATALNLTLDLLTGTGPATSPRTKAGRSATATPGRRAVAGCSRVASRHGSSSTSAHCRRPATRTATVCSMGGRPTGWTPTATERSTSTSPASAPTRYTRTCSSNSTG